MFGFINKIFIGLIASEVSASSHAKCVLLSKQKSNLLLIYMLMSILKDYLNIHLRLI